MNSVLQIFFNIPEMKNIFLKNSEASEETDERNKDLFSQDLLHFIFKEHKNNFLLKSFLNLNLMNQFAINHFFLFLL